MLEEQTARLIERRMNRGEVQVPASFVWATTERIGEGPAHRVRVHLRGGEQRIITSVEGYQALAEQAAARSR